MNDNIHTTALDEGGFLTKPAIAAMAAATGWRHMMVLIRYGCGRISVAAEDVEHSIGKIEAAGDYVRDVCLIAGTLPTDAPRRKELRELLGDISDHSERGAASIILSLDDGQITATHGTDNVVLGRTETTALGDWDRLIDFLKSDLGVKWVAP